MQYALGFIRYAFVIAVCKSLCSDAVKASVERDPGLSNANHKGQPSNQISVKEEQRVKAEDQLYYLPLQTDFGAHPVAGPGSVFTTSPPHISIEPDPVHIKTPESTSILYEEVPVKEYNAASQCVSETPVIELESRFLFPSSDAIKESVVMSGHLEVASKTSSVEEASEELSKPSVVLQGTEFHSHTLNDL